MHLKKWIIASLALLVFTSGCLTALSDESDKITLKELKFNITLEPSLEAAKTQGKPLFIYFRSESCGWCKKFEAESFTNQSIVSTLNKNFILVAIDVYKQKNETRYFRVRGTPTEVFLDSDGTEIGRLPGYVDNQTFLNTINEIVNKTPYSNTEIEMPRI